MVSVVRVGGVTADPGWIELNSITAKSSTPIPNDNFLLVFMKHLPRKVHHFIGET